jgi:proline iminopeptidase
MRTALVLGLLVSAAAAAREFRVPVGTADLYAREIGRGQPIVVLHGGPDFDHNYFLPDMDRLSDSYRLVYYDQRGRGKSADRVQPDDVTLDSEIADLDKVRQYVQLNSIAVLGHSWGAVLALEYVIRHPDRVSHLILMNPAPASAADFAQLRKERAAKLGADLDRMRAIAATDSFKEGDPDTVAALYRIHFKPALARSEDLDKVIGSLRASFTKQGILKARKIEDRLTEETWLSPKGYDLLPKLATLRVPALVIYGDHDFIPADSASHIARAIPGARLVTLKDCGHFSYLECPGAVRKELDDFFRQGRSSR